MFSFIVRRLLIIFPMMLLVVSVTWALIRMAPGNIYTSEKKLPPAVEENIRKKYGLDKSVPEQYWLMISNVFMLDFGSSLKYPDRTVNQIIKDHFPYSATLGI